MKDIKGFEGQYAITEDGRVWSYPKLWRSGTTRQRNCSHNGKFLAPGVHSGGYLCIRLNGPNARMAYLHRLVAQAYVPNPHRRKEVNHKDGDKKNNHYSNLEWTTRKQNARHAKTLNVYGPKSPARGERHFDAKLTEKDVLELRYMWDLGMPLAVLFASYEMSKSAMYAVCTRRNWTHLP